MTIETAPAYDKIVTELMAEMSKVEAEINLKTAEKDAEIIAAKSAIIEKYKPILAELEAKMEKVKKPIQTILRKNQEDFIGEGKSPSRSNEFGTWGWHDGNDTVEIYDLDAFIAFFNANPKTNADLGRTQIKPNKQGIKNRLTAGSEVPGCRLGGKRRSFVELKDNTAQPKEA